MSFWSLALLLYFATWLSVPHLLSLRKRPAATLAWLWGILLFPYVGALLYWAIGTDRFKRKRLRRREQFKSSRELIRGLTSPELQPLDQRERELARLLSAINETPVSSVSEAKLLATADEFYDRLVERIDAAKQHVHIQVFIWRKDASGDRLLQAAVNAAKRGVEVRVLLDELGSILMRTSYFKPLIAAGGRFSWFLTINPRRGRYLFNLRNHRKLQIIDGQYAFVGGMNIGEEYRGLDRAIGPWKDLQIEVQGSIVKVLQESFADDWYFATREQLTHARYFPEQKPVEPRTPAILITGGPDSPKIPVEKSLVALLNLARTRVWLTTGYFTPNEVVVTALQLCAMRGVDVRLLISEKTDHPLMLRIGRSYYPELLSAGVRIFEYSHALNHTKAGVIDDEWLMVGSANLDNRSLRLNFEMNLLISQAKLARELSDLIENYFKDSLEITPQNFARRPRLERMLEAVCRPIGPVM
jgi:cardiolipin synthase A/B